MTDEASSITAHFDWEAQKAAAYSEFFELNTVTSIKCRKEKVCGGFDKLFESIVH